MLKRNAYRREVQVSSLAFYIIQVILVLEVLKNVNGWPYCFDRYKSGRNYLLKYQPFKA